MTHRITLILTPVPNLAVEVHGDLEHALRREVEFIEVQAPGVRRTTNSLLTGRDEDGRTRFIWILEVELDPGATSPPDQAIRAVVDETRQRFASHASMSEPFVPSTVGS